MDNAHKLSVLKQELRNKVLVLSIDNPPVNALSAALRRELLGAIHEADTNDKIEAVLIIGCGRYFIAGADVREFGKPPLPPLLPDVCTRIEACNKLVVAAIHGAALGGGLEIALAAHYRLIAADAKVGFPEVALGLLPGAGGTQRAPRLIGAKASLDLMLNGRPSDARDAHELGLIDRLVYSEDMLAEGLAYLMELLAAHAPVRRSRDAGGLTDHATSRAAIEAARSEMTKKSRGLFSPLKIITAVQAALELPFNEGLSLERSLFLQCIDSPQRAGLIHAFFLHNAKLSRHQRHAVQRRAR